MEGCDNDQVLFSTDFTQRDSLTKDEKLFYWRRRDLRYYYRDFTGFAFSIKLNTSSTFANTHDSTTLQTKVISKGKLEYVFNLTIKLMDLDEFLVDAAIAE